MSSEDFRKTIADLRGMLDGSYSAPSRASFDPETDALFGGLSRAALHCTAAELLPGLELRQTYAHVFSPAMIAFAPPPAPRAAHPAPWQAVDGGGIAETIAVEVFLAPGARPFALGRVETVRLVASMIRLVAASPVCMPILSNMPFAAVPGSGQQAAIRGLEPAHNWPLQQVAITPAFVEMIQRMLQPASVLLSEDDVYRAFNLVDGMWWLPSWSAQMLALWTAAETLMRPGRQRVGAALADSIRAYLARDRSDGDRLYNEVARLYSARGSAAHAGMSPDGADMDASYRIVREILLRCFAEAARPPRRADIVPLWSS